MAKIVLENATSGFRSTTASNANYDLIEAEFQDKVLYRNNPTGEPNHMESTLDMNSNRIINLPSPVSGSEPARWQDVRDGVSVIGESIPSLTGNQGKVVSTDGDVLTLREAPFTVDNYATLRLLDPTLMLDGSVIEVTDSGIEGSGILRNVVAHGLTDNGWSIIVVSANFYWQRTYFGKANIRWLGDFTDGATDTTAAVELIAATSKVIYFPSTGSEVYDFDSVPTLPAGTTCLFDRYDAFTGVTAAQLNAYIINSGIPYGVISSPDEMRDRRVEVISGTIRQQQFRAVAGITRSGSVATVNMVDHGYDVGDYFVVAGSTTTGYNGTFLIDSVINVDSFTVALTADLLVQQDSGTTDGTGASLLIDSTQNFLTTVTPGAMVVNTTDGTTTNVAVVNSNTQLTLRDDIFVSGETYTIGQPAHPTTALGTITGLSPGVWEYIKDSTHEPLGVNDSISVNPSGTGIGLTINFNKTFSKVLTFTCTPDEQISASSGMSMGASVSLSGVEIRGSIDKTIAGRLQYDATSGWLISMGNDQGIMYIENAPSPVENIYYDAGNLYISHGYCPGQNVSITWNTLNGTTFTYMPVIKTVANNYTIANFIRLNAGVFELYTGAVQAGMCLQFTKNYSGPIYFDGRDRSGEIGNQFGNIWFFGIMQV